MYIKEPKNGALARACLVLIMLLAGFSVYSAETHSSLQIKSDNQTKSKNHKLQCTFDNIVFDSNFPAGRISACSKLGEGHYLLETHPENIPINPSPWYAFSVELTDKYLSDNQTKQTKQTVRVSIRAQDSRARYIPKISHTLNTRNYHHWQSLPFEFDEQGTTIEVPVSTVRSYVAAQEIINSSYYEQWNKELAASSRLTLVNIGESVLGKEIQALIHNDPQNTEWVLIIGRQHPPELTGAMAMLSFTEALISDAELNKGFYERFNLLIVPLLNPDGVDAGNWRHNVNGIDLNRDWGKFTQAETQAVDGLIKKHIKGDNRLVFALDFHSTQQDIFYTMPSDYIPVVYAAQNIESSVVPTEWVNEWLASLQQQTLRSFVIRNRPGTSPGRGVFKQYIADEFGVHAVTFELGDNTNRVMIEHLARQSAKEMTAKLLNTPADAFVVTPP